MENNKNILPIANPVLLLPPGNKISKTLLVFNGVMLGMIVVMVFAIYGVLHKPIGNKVISQKKKIVQTKFFLNCQFRQSRSMCMMC